jgi:CubicO group peptidase (beta-lactamase class C family)
MALDDELPLFFAGELPLQKNRIRIRHLLSHSSGLPAYHPYFKQYEPRLLPGNSARIVQAIVDEPLVYEPGGKCVYSDLGFILLGEIVQRVSGSSLVDCFRKYVSGPAGLIVEMVYITVLHN